jgi:hypothetical protein
MQHVSLLRKMARIEGQAFVTIAKVVFELPEADTGDLQMQFNPIGALSLFC